MIIVKLVGGLGNQLFQYAFAKSLAKRKNDTLYFDVTSFSDNESRKFNVTEFNVNVELLEIAYLKKIFSRKDRFLRKIGASTNNIHFEKRPSFYEVEYLSKKTNYYSGYWQSERYFKEIAETIRVEFSLQTPLPSNRSLDMIENEQSVAIHIRRGDYASDKNVNNYHGVLPESYYAKASHYIKARIPEASFMIFTDDAEWAETKFNLPFNYSIFDQSLYSDAQILSIMSSCKHHIIANSSFSWWAAWLNNNVNKIVISPKQWFKEAEKSKDLIPENWTEI